VVDGGSSDATESLVDAYSPRARFVAAKGTSQAEALNLGFNLARGSIIGWLNADDWYFDSHVASTAVDSIVARQSACLAYGDAVYIDADNNLIGARTTPEFDYDRLTRYSFIPQPTIFFSQSIAASQQIDTQFELCLDSEWMLRVGKLYEIFRIPRFQAVFTFGASTKLSGFGQLRYKEEIHKKRLLHERRPPKIASSWLDKLTNLKSILAGRCKWHLMGVTGKADYKRLSRLFEHS